MRRLTLLALLLSGVLPAQSTWPTTPDTKTNLLVDSNFFGSNLSSSITATQTSITVNSASNLAVNQELVIDFEVIKITAISGTTLTVVRGQDVTAAASHSQGAKIYRLPNAAYHNALQSAILAIESTPFLLQNTNPTGQNCNTPYQVSWLPQQALYACIPQSGGGNVWQQALAGGSGGSANAVSIQGIPVSPATPGAGQVLQYLSGIWAPGTIVQSFAGRTGAVVPAAGDYSASLISGLAPSATIDATNATNITTGILLPSLFPSSIGSNTTGNAATATAFAAAPTGCSANLYQTASDISGNSICNQVTYPQIGQVPLVSSNNNSTFTATASTFTFGAAAHTTPTGVGASLPNTCVVGEEYFSTTAAAGSNIYLCTSANSWTPVQGSGGGGGGGTQLGPGSQVAGSVTLGTIVDGDCAAGTFAATGIAVTTALTPISVPTAISSNNMTLLMSGGANTVQVTVCNLSEAAVTLPATVFTASYGTVNGIGNYSQSFTSQTSVTLAHNLNTTGVITACYDGSSRRMDPATTTINNSNSVTVTFLAAKTGSCTVNGGPTYNNSGGGGGGGTTVVQVNGTNLTVQSPANFVNSAPTNGVTLSFANPSNGNVQLGLTGQLSVPGGGTGSGTFTAHAPLIGEGAAAFNSIMTGTTGQPMLSGGSTADPAYGALNLAGGSSILTGILPIGSGGNGSATPAITGSGNIAVTGSWPAQNVVFSGILPITSGGTGTNTPALIAGSNIGITGSWPNNTLAFSGILPVANGGNGSASPGITAGTNIAVTGSWPTQQIGFNGTLPVASGGTGTATPGLVAGSNVTITGTWPNQTISSSGGGGSGSSAWSALTNATSSLTLSNAGFGTTFTQTSPVNWLWANTTAATSSVNQSSPVFNMCGQAWEGSTPSNVQDCWTIQNVVANGSNPAPTLTFVDATASTATPAVSVPNLKTTATFTGNISFTNGTGSIPALPSNSAGFAGPASGGTSYLFKMPTTASAGLLTSAAPAPGADGVNESTLSFSALPLSASNGGTGNSTNTAHGVMVGEGTSALAATGTGTSGQALLSGGASADPAYGALNLGGTSTVTGTLPCGQMPALTGDTTSTAGSCATTNVKINGGTIPASTAVLASNSSDQLIGATTTGTGSTVVMSGGPTLTGTATVNNLTISGTCTGCPNTSWSSLLAPSANQALSMGSFTTTFNQSTTTNWKWANTTAATSSVNQSSPVINVCGQGWEGATPANAADCWTVQNVLANGSNPNPTLTFLDSTTSTGTPTVSVPNLNVTTQATFDNVTVTGTCTGCGGGGGSSALSAITAATGSNTLANGNNPQTWNWAQTTNTQSAFTFGETTAATGTGDIELNVQTKSTSTALPIQITAQGTANGWNMATSGLWEPIGTGSLAVGGTTHGVVVSEGSTTALATTATGSSGQALLSGGSSADPAYGALSLSGSAVTGTLPAASVGSGYPFSNLAAASASTTLANGNNPLTFNFAQTTNSQSAVTIGETTAATGTSDIELNVQTKSASTALPLQVTAGGTSNGWNMSTAGLWEPLGTGALATGGTAHTLAVNEGATTAIASVGPGTSGQLVTSQGSSSDPHYIDFPEVDKIPAANCNNTTAGNGWSIGSGGTVTCRAGTNNQSGYIAITDTSTTFAQFTIPIPEDWDTNTNPYIRFGVATADTTSGHTIIPQIKVTCSKGDGTTTDDVTFNAAHSSSTITTNTTANQFWSNSNVQMNSTDMTGCVAGAMMTVQVGRATDTATSANFYYATVTFPRLLTVQAN